MGPQYAFLKPCHATAAREGTKQQNLFAELFGIAARRRIVFKSRREGIVKVNGKITTYSSQIGVG